ncbi:MAG: hypothetical protein WBL95_09145 [Microcoleus sp.]
MAIHFYEKETSMPYALCPMPYALCPMPYAHEHLQKPEKGYIVSYSEILSTSLSGGISEF